MPRFFHDKNSKCTRAVFAGRLSQPSGSLLSGAPGAFRGFHPAAGFPAVLPQRIRKRKPPPYIPLRKSVPPQRAAPPAAIPRGTAPDTASAPRLLPPEKAKAPPEPRENVKAPANRTARAVPGRGTVPAALDKEAARARAGKRSRTGPGSRITPLRQKTAWSLPGTKRSRGESSKNACLSLKRRKRTWRQYTLFRLY